LLTKLDGLDDEQLRRLMVPSGLCLLGLVKHLSTVEFGWFDSVFLQSGKLHPFEREGDPEAEFRIEDEDGTDFIVESYLSACEHGRVIVAEAKSLDQTVPHPRGIGEIDLRRILIHMIEETARHNGHADIMRELIDGATGD
jgi:uncharacterized damage-inducible protein DinB